jgi:transglutaminase-like putative cysteine protease
MLLKVGYELIYECPQPTPMILSVNVHHSRVDDLVVPDRLQTGPAVDVRPYHDGFGNLCSRLTLPAGRTVLWSNAVVRDAGLADEVAPWARQQTVQDLPDETLVFLLGSRYCDTDKLSQIAWDLFNGTPLGWGRVQAICDYVHSHISFGYHHGRPSKSALDAFNERNGVCRDFAHLAVAFCRCMNIPARYCTGYLSDVGEPPPYAEMDFAAWFEAWLDGRWYVFDPRNHTPRKGRVLIARGRDAADVPISNAFGPNTLTGFKVWTDEILGPAGVGEVESNAPTAPRRAAAGIR